MTAKVTYRQLQAGDELPTGEPRRYRDGRGYIRLRWLVGTQAYVEVYEHRLVAGLPDAEVHHGNHHKGDNDPTNLLPLTKREHAALHGELAHQRSVAARRARDEAKEQAKAQRWLEIARLYRSGLSTIEVGGRVGLDSSNVSRGLRAIGVTLRPCGGHNRSAVDEDDVADRLRAPGARAGAVARDLGVSMSVVIRIRTARGIPAAPVGRPAAIR